jgi:molybdate/tungstate transport system substrate-binding protein
LEVGRAHAEVAPAALTVFYASTLSGFVREVARRYAAGEPGGAVRGEASGSLDAIRKVTDLERSCDVVISADWRLLARERRGLDPWVLVFAGNAMGIIYTARAPGAGEISARNWYRVLMRDGVRYAYPDPQRDPEGYWTLIVWQLAERFYGVPGLARALEEHRFAPGVRPASAQMIPLLQSGELDYYFSYVSEARAAGLKVLALPAKINLGDMALAPYYVLARALLQEGAARRTIAGAAIGYGATLCRGAANARGAERFLRILAGPDGRRLARKAGLIGYDRPYFVDPLGQMPAWLRALAQPMPAVAASERPALR